MKPKWRVGQQAQDLLDLAENLSAQNRAAVKVGVRMRDQLLRALVPLYLIRSGTLGLNGGDIDRFWCSRRVNFSSSNAMKALRWHIGYASHRQSKSSGTFGWVITPNGVKYVEAAVRPLAKRAVGP